METETERGESIAVDYDDRPAVEKSIDSLIVKANAHLPSGTVYEIRGKVVPDDPIYREPLNRNKRTRRELAKEWGVAWYWTLGAMDQQPLFRTDVGHAQSAPLGGYIVIARIRAP